MNASEIMQKQLELLAEKSKSLKNSDPEQLVAISLAMVEIAKNRDSYL